MAGEVASRVQLPDLDRKEHARMLKQCALRTCLLLALAVFAASAGDALGQEAKRQGLGASFFEDFSTFDRRRWFVSDGWNSGGFQSCTYAESHVHAREGALELRLTDTPSARGPYTCAEVQSLELYGHGLYEVRMRAAAATPGVVSAFFTFIRPPHDELDIEFVGKQPKQVQLNYFVNGAPQRGKNIDLEFDTTTAMNDYAVEWLPDALRWFVNGRLIYEVKKGNDTPFPVQPSKIHLSIWSGSAASNDWLGPFVYPGPLTARFEHVAYTQAGKPCQFPTSIICARAAKEKPQ
jgi:endo-1,3-1,4-beta-glycanase ExoK